ncbi:mucin-6 [Antechinus flavipes]|uniref:mucin-6 n=1 Tax=Antechinus flavipes TaxID=38775 RepID=UPI002235CE6C|nr:mucin-6 [Antechinus flavipes]
MGGTGRVRDGWHLLPWTGLEDNYFANKLRQREKRALMLGGKTKAPTTPGLGAAASLAREEEEDLPSTPDRGWCSTWGGGHISTFDKYLYDFGGTCNYIFAAVCDDASPDFDIQLRRGPGNKIARIIIEVGPSCITVEDSAISIKDVGVVSLPYTGNGLQITPFGQSVRLVAKLLEMELVVMWNGNDYLMVMVEAKYMKKTCGLCGNFDGEENNEFQSEGKFLEAYEYAALQKLDDPTEICAYEELPTANSMPRDYTQLCLQLLTQVGPDCNVSKDAFAARCQMDLRACPEPARPNCSCHTLSEYSRQCSMSGQQVTNWRRPNFCSLEKCPANQIYKECGTPCRKTCSNPAHSCPSFCTFGCFCPEGTVLDDITGNHSCVPIEQCPCTLNRVIYAPGQVMKAACRTCHCASGQWNCSELPCPGRCSLEGGSFITTFDSRPYRFHGTCTYILVKSPSLPNNGTLMAVYDKSGYSHSETALVAVIYTSTKDKIVISQDELLTDDGDVKWLPYQTGDITIFRQTSTHLQMATLFGLELVVQLRPVFQVYVRVGPQFKGNTRGLCGNYNGDTTDDFLTSMNIIEGTASLFVDSWRSGNCPSALERETDPCSMSQLNKVCAESHCSVLVKKGTVFEACHAVVNPAPFYKRCVYQACNYEETFPYICAALGSYARMCASMGLVLTNWRSAVDNCTVSCAGNQTFSYESQACDRTCLSLADRSLECHPSDIPVDGCNCPEGTYLDHKNECVRRSRCPCFLEDRKFILADQSTIIRGIPCYCVNGKLSCTGKPSDPSESCKAPKKYLSCSQSSDSKYGAACAPTCQMLATGIECVPTKCESGCVCGGGLYEDLNGDCVPPDDCPCEFGGLSYSRGAQIQTECKTCTCMRGKWQCAKKDKCSSTCALYGEGHLTTFDGQRFVFDGNCEYVLTTDGCSVNNSDSTFKIVTENVVCGKSGVTCSRAIKLFIGDLSLVLSDATYTITGQNPRVSIHVKKNALHLVFDILIPGKFSLTLVWNKRMSVSIKVFRDSQDPLCGLCGNYNGNMKDDFETRSKYVASSELEFVNSWKENPLCGDISFVVDPCLQNPYRKAWAEKKCAIINSNTFSACHSKVYRMPYYDACVRDTCGCDSGGDCECMCDAVAAYAKACLDVGVCVDWRAPDFCPLYCDFYNTHKLTSGDGSYEYTRDANCTWHYQPCLCPFYPQSNRYINVEGCYNCTLDHYFDHEEGRCVPCSKTLLPTPSTATTGECSTSKCQGPHSKTTHQTTRGTETTTVFTTKPSSSSLQTPSTSSRLTRPTGSISSSSRPTSASPVTFPTSPQASGRTTLAVLTSTRPRITSAIPWSTTITVAVTSSALSETPGTRPLGSTVRTSPITEATSENPGSFPTTTTQSTARSTARTTATSGTSLRPTLTIATPAGTSRGPESQPHTGHSVTTGTPESNQTRTTTRGQVTKTPVPWPEASSTSKPESPGPSPTSQKKPHTTEMAMEITSILQSTTNLNRPTATGTTNAQTTGTGSQASHTTTTLSPTTSSQSTTRASSTGPNTSSVTPPKHTTTAPLSKPITTTTSTTRTTIPQTGSVPTGTTIKPTGPSTLTNIFYYTHHGDREGYHWNHTNGDTLPLFTNNHNFISHSLESEHNSSLIYWDHHKTHRPWHCWDNVNHWHTIRHTHTAQHNHSFLFADIHHSPSHNNDHLISPFQLTNIFYYTHHGDREGYHWNYTNGDTLPLFTNNHNFITHSLESEHNSSLICWSQHFFSHSIQTHNHCTPLPNIFYYTHLGHREGYHWIHTNWDTLFTYNHNFITHSLESEHNSSLICWSQHFFSHSIQTHNHCTPV